MQCKEVKTSEDIKKFISLPEKIYYDKRLNPQDKKTELQILKGTHPLSKEFKAYGYIVTDGEKVISRAVLTIYKSGKSAYMGFFESKDNIDAVRLLVYTIMEKAIQSGAQSIIGPVDCSFWIRYRCKVNNFDTYYTGEPYNPEYYDRLFKNVGFKVYEEYYSLGLRVPTESDINPKFVKRLHMVESNGIQIRTLKPSTFSKDFINIFRLLNRLYSKFPVYKNISEDEFKKVFGYFRFILDYKMVFVAYKDNQLKGFMVCIPDYKSNSVFSIKTGKCKNYIMMYLGADETAYGLGGAFAEICRQEMQKRNSKCIMALIHQGNTSGVLYRELAESKYEYRLYKMELAWKRRF